MIEQQSIEIHTRGRATIEITAEIDAAIRNSAIRRGLCHVFLHHTSASLIITENADRDVQTDLENYIAKLVRDGDPAYLHDQEGPDDMAAHIRSVLTQTEISIPLQSGRASPSAPGRAFFCGNIDIAAIAAASRSRSAVNRNNNEY